MSFKLYGEFTDINLMYNPQDTTMKEAQTMRFQVMLILSACPHNVTSDFHNINITMD